MVWVSLVMFERSVDHVHNRLNQDSSFSVHEHTPNKRAKCHSRSLHPRKTWPRFCSTGKRSTSLAPTVEVVDRRTSERLARLRDIGVGHPLFRFFERPPLTAAAAANSSKRTISRASMPRNHVVNRCIFRIGHVVGWSPQRLATIAEERVDLGHHSSPQQIVHLPLRCRGLHLSPCSPCTRPLSGATCDASRPMDRCIALRTAVCTHRERLPLVVFCAKKSRYSAAWLVRLTVMTVFLSLIIPCDV